MCDCVAPDATLREGGTSSRTIVDIPNSNRLASYDTAGIPSHYRQINYDTAEMI
jgi:hypothetical protein